MFTRQFYMKIDIIVWLNDIALQRCIAYNFIDE